MAYNKDFVIVNDIKRDYSNRFRVHTVQYELKFRSNGLIFFETFLDWYRECFRNVLVLVKSNALPHHKIGLLIALPTVEDAQPIFVPFTRCDQLTEDMIMDVIESVIQSNKAFEDGENFVIQATILETINGGAGGMFFIMFSL